MYEKWFINDNKYLNNFVLLRNLYFDWPCILTSLCLRIHLHRTQIGKLHNYTAIYIQTYTYVHSVQFRDYTWRDVTSGKIKRAFFAEILHNTRAFYGNSPEICNLPDVTSPAATFDVDSTSKYSYVFQRFFDVEISTSKLQIRRRYFDGFLFGVEKTSKKRWKIARWVTSNLEAGQNVY